MRAERDGRRLFVRFERAKRKRGVMTEVLNTMFNSANIGDRTVRNFSPDTDLFELARRSGTFTNEQVEFFGSFPTGLRAALMGVMRDNFNWKKPLAIQFVWAPAYDFGLKIYEDPAHHRALVESASSSRRAIHSTRTLP